MFWPRHRAPCCHQDETALALTFRIRLRWPDRAATPLSAAGRSGRAGRRQARSTFYEVGGCQAPCRPSFFLLRQDTRSLSRRSEPLISTRGSWRRRAHRVDVDHSAAVPHSTRHAGTRLAASDATERCGLRRTFYPWRCNGWHHAPKTSYWKPGARPSFSLSVSHDTRLSRRGRAPARARAAPRGCAGSAR